MHRPAIIVICALTLLSCRKEHQPIDLVTFPLRGVVLHIDTVAHRITIAHDAIPNYMPAMTMPFHVKNPALLKAIAVGDSVGATLAVSRTESWLETLQRLRGGEKVAALSAEQIELRHLYQDGQQVPDIHLINQDGRPIRLSSFRGQTLVVTFIYTRCPLPDFCVRMSQQFADLQHLLKADPSMKGRWHLLSISFDPAFDRPAVLKEYGNNYGADFAVWDFATDPDTSGAALGKFIDGFGLTYEPSEGLIEHNLRTAVIDKEGRLVTVFRGNEWTAKDLAKAVKQAA
jgi:protein SCO1/2